MASWNMVLQDEYPPGSLACKVFNESTLDCSRRELNTIPSISKHTFRSVDLSDNKIKMISPTVFAGQIQLTSIDFTTNQLQNITGSPFADLGSLLYLNMSNNQISFLAYTAFSGLHNLELLDISSNKLESVPIDIFRDLHSLRLLDLSFNQLTEVPNSALSPLRNLEVLHLQYPFKSATFGPEFESMSSLNTFSFASMEKMTLTNSTFQHFRGSPVRTLAFVWHPLTKAEVGIFKTLKNVEFVMTGPYGFRAKESLFLLPSSVKKLHFIVACHITREFFMPLSNLNESLTDLVLGLSSIAKGIKIGGFVFEWFPSLRQLDISKASNDRIQLSDEIFCGLNQLEALSLKRIMLTSIPSAAFKAFANTQSLKRLDLRENSLTGNFPPDAFISVTSLEYLDLSYNPITYLTKWIESLTNLTCIILNGGNKKQPTWSSFVVLWDKPLYSLKEMRLDDETDSTTTGLAELILSHIQLQILKF